MYCSTSCHTVQPLGCQNTVPGAVLVDVEQVQFAAQLAVVALLGLLQHRQVLLQVVLGGPGRAVDALQHLVAVVAAPVGAGHLHQLEVLELARAGHVRAAAQVLEAAFAVQADTSWSAGMLAMISAL
jgi:hypothetical protein